MSPAVLSAAVSAVLALVAVVGLFAGWYCYARYPWQRVNRRSRVPVGTGTVALTRLGVSAGFLLFVPVAVGTWAYYVGTMTELRSMSGVDAAPPTLHERVAVALPGELLVAAGLLGATVAMVAPFVLVLRDVATALLGRREA